MELTPKENKVFKFICNSINKDGYSPSVQDVATFMGYKSKRSAALIIEKLVSMGLVQRRLDGHKQLKLCEVERKPSALGICGDSWNMGINAAMDYLDQLQLEQRERNTKYPMHVEAYPVWEQKVGWLQQLRDEIEKRKISPISSEAEIS